MFFIDYYIDYYRLLAIIATNFTVRTPAVCLLQSPAHMRTLQLGAASAEPGREPESHRLGQPAPSALASDSETPREHRLGRSLIPRRVPAPTPLGAFARPLGSSQGS